MNRPVEIWTELVASVHWMRRLVVANTVLAILALATTSFAVHVALSRPLAYHIDTTGEATFIGRLREQGVPLPAEITYVAKRVWTRSLGVNALTVEADFADALNLETPELQHATQSEWKKYEEEHHQSFIQTIKANGIQTNFAFDDGKLEIINHGDQAYTVHLVGTARSSPLNRAGNDAAFFDHDFDALITLVRVPRTETSPNGLLVADIATKMFKEPKPQTTAATEVR